MTTTTRQPDSSNRSSSPIVKSSKPSLASWGKNGHHTWKADGPSGKPGKFIKNVTLKSGDSIWPPHLPLLLHYPLLNTGTTTKTLFQVRAMLYLIAYISECAVSMINDDRKVNFDVTAAALCEPPSSSAGRRRPITSSNIRGLSQSLSVPSSLFALTRSSSSSSSSAASNGNCDLNYKELPPPKDKDWWVMMSDFIFSSLCIIYNLLSARIYMHA